MRSGGGHDAHPEAWRQPGQHRVAFVVERMTVMGQLDADPGGTEPVHQIGQCPLRRVRATVGKCLTHTAFAASGQDVPVTTGRLGQRFVVVARLALLAAGQVRRGQLPRQPSVALRAAGQHQQMRAGRIRLLGAGAGSQRQLGAEHGTHVEFRGRFGEPHRPVQAVVVGQREGTQIQPGSLLDQLLRRAGPVEKAVRRMRMQLGIRDGRADLLAILRRLIHSALARPGDIVGGLDRRGRAGMARLAVEHPLHFRPARRPVEPAHIPQSIECMFDRLIGPSERVGYDLETACKQFANTRGTKTYRGC